MAHGIKPYGRTAPNSTIFGLQDMGELAARLWSPNTFNRLGNTLFMDGFEGSLNKWGPNTSGVGALVEISNERARNGLVSCHMVGGNTLGRWATIDHHEPYPVLSSFGFECSVSQGAQVQEYRTQFDCQDALNLTRFGWRYCPPTDDLDIFNNLWGWTNIGNRDLGIQTTNFHTFKVVVDPVAREYRYLIVDDTVYNLAGVGGAPFGGAAPPILSAMVIVESVIANNGHIWVDDAILTQNEP